jgi:nitroreductase
MSVARAILELARWAPSGDNTQPWRFEIVADDHVVVHAFDTRRHCLYDLDGHASQLSVGALLETMRIAASVHGLALQWTRRMDEPEELPVFDVHFVADQSIAPDPLHASVRERSVQRRALSRRAIDSHDKALLEAAVGAAFTVVWFATSAERRRVAWLAARSANIIITIPEA